MEAMPIEQVDEDYTSKSEGILKSERGNFMAKVYGIVAAQLGVTAVFCGVATSDEGSAFFLDHFALGMVMMVVSFASLLPLAFSARLARTFPANYGFLLVFTVSESYLLGVVCAYYEAGSVLVAILISTVIVVGLTVYAAVSREDFTAWGGALLVGLLGLILFSVMAMFVNRPILNTALSAAGAVLFGLYLVADTQMIIGQDNREVTYDIDDYIMAAMNIYLDVINIFLYVLRIVGERRS